MKKTETLEEFLARGGKIKKAVLSEDTQRRWRRSIPGRSKYSFRDLPDKKTKGIG